MQFLDPTNDYAFKKVFGDEHKKSILLSFLNSILERKGDETITEVTLLNPSQAPHIKGAKETLLDVRCHDQSGAEYIVELQVIYKKYFDKRVQYYVSKAYSSQLAEGEQYGGLRPVIFLGVLNFQLTENGHYVSTHRVQDVEMQEHVFQDFQFTLIELPKFSKDESALENVADKWIYFLKNAKALQAVPAVIEEAALKEAFEIVNRINWNQHDMDLYEERVKAWRDRAAEIEGGYDQGRKVGHAEGLAEGVERGRLEERSILARKLLAARLDIAIIRQATGLSSAELDALDE